MAAVPESAEWILRAMNHQGQHTDQPATPPANLIVPPEESSALRRGGKAVLLGLYRLARPVLRPILWRTRAFFAQPALGEIAEVKQLFLTEIASLRHQIEITGAELAILRDELREQARDRKIDDSQAAASTDKDLDSLMSELRREVEAQDRSGPA
jgi:hypothetical protein